MDKVTQWFDHLLAQTWLQRTQSSKLQKDYMLLVLSELKTESEKACHHINKVCEQAFQQVVLYNNGTLIGPELRCLKSASWKSLLYEFVSGICKFVSSLSN